MFRRMVVEKFYIVKEGSRLHTDYWEDFVRRHVDFTSYEKPHANLSSMSFAFPLSSGTIHPSPCFRNSC